MRAGAVGGPVLALLLGAVTPALAAGPAPLEQARQAAEHLSFEGTLQVGWRDGTVTRTEHLAVEAAGGALLVRGANQVMARPAFGRLLAHGIGGWEEMWLPSLAPGPRPDGASKYATTAPADGPSVAGRTTRVVEVRLRGALLERIYLDRETDILLGRDQFDGRGDVLRNVGFETFRLAPSASAPAPPPSPAHHAQQVVAMDHLPASTVAPGILADGYQRTGIYRAGAVTQVLYSDGLYDLSLFEQEGRLRHADLPPSGEQVAVGTANGWRYPWPGGQLVVWSTGGKVFTAVSDAPTDQVLAAVRSLPASPSHELSLLGKARRACQALMQPLV